MTLAVWLPIALNMSLMWSRASNLQFSGLGQAGTHRHVRNSQNNNSNNDNTSNNKFGGHGERGAERRHLVLWHGTFRYTSIIRITITITITLTISFTVFITITITITVTITVTISLIITITIMITIIFGIIFYVACCRAAYCGAVYLHLYWCLCL